jgi:hypothetical protein
MKHFFHRQSLYERIWTEPRTRVAPELAIDPARLKQACECAAIPLPPTAYWARLRSGKNPERTPLPPRPHGADCIVELGYCFSHEDTLAAMPMPEPVFEESVEAMTARIAPILAAASPAPVRGNFSSIAMLYAPPSPPGKKAARPQRSPIELRRYQIIADLCSLLGRTGGLVDAIEDEKGRRFRIAIYGTLLPVFFSVEEAQQALWLETDGAHQLYTDRPERQIEDRLHEIAGALLIAAETRLRLSVRGAYERDIENRKRAEEYARKDRERREERAEQRRRDRARERRDELISQVNRWKHAENIRAFVAGVLADFPDHVPAKLDGWAQWALREADAIDPTPEVHRNPPERRKTGNPL